MPQASVAVTVVISTGGSVALHPSVTVGGQVMVGGVMSTILVIVCEQVAVLPHASVAMYVLIVVSIQPLIVDASLTCDTVGVPQASVAVTVVISTGGSVALHPSFTVGGQVITGGVISTIRVMVWLHVAVLPHASVAM